MIDFTIEKRGDCHVLVCTDGGCRPAEDTEIELFAALAEKEAAIKEYKEKFEKIETWKGDCLEFAETQRCSCGRDVGFMLPFGAAMRIHEAEAAIRERDAEIARMKEHTWCAYCGLEIHIDDEAATKISEHIMSCEKHPIHIALADNADLRAKLAAVEKALFSVPKVGHSDDCLFCGFKDRVVVEYSLSLKETDHEMGETQK